MQTTRRKFLQSSSAALVATFVPRHVLGGAGHVAPSDRVNIALVGAGGQGLSNLRRLFREADARVVAVADPCKHYSLENFYYGGVSGRLPVKQEIEKHYQQQDPGFQCRDYIDFREMLEHEAGLDAVLCATPDHLHAYVSIRAMRAGKHVYCEKPLTHNMWEAWEIVRVAEETGVATQMGNQGHARDGIRQTCEWIWDGAIGTVREVHAWVPSGRWNPKLVGRPTPDMPVPDGLNWDLWLGPREPRPFHTAYAPVSWRDFWAFGSGTLGDFGCHDLDAAKWALDLGTPTSVEAYPAGPMDEEITPHGEICYFEFPARGDQPPVRVTWYDGGLKPSLPTELIGETPLSGRGVLFVGDEGVMLCGGAGGDPKLLPETRDKEYVRPEQTLPRTQGHHRDWLDACKGGASAGSNFAYGARLTELVLLGNLALRTGKKIRWNEEQLSAEGVPEAEPMIHGTYRDGWGIG